MFISAVIGAVLMTAVVVKSALNSYSAPASVTIVAGARAGAVAPLDALPSVLAPSGGGRPPLPPPRAPMPSAQQSSPHMSQQPPPQSQGQIPSPQRSSAPQSSNRNTSSRFGAENLAARLTLASLTFTHSFWRKLRFVRTLVAFLTFYLIIFLTIIGYAPKCCSAPCPTRPRST